MTMKVKLIQRKKTLRSEHNGPSEPQRGKNAKKPQKLFASNLFFLGGISDGNCWIKDVGAEKVFLRFSFKSINRLSNCSHIFQAEPIMYSCTVSVTKTISSKELDDLILVDSFNSMATR